MFRAPVLGLATIPGTIFSDTGVGFGIFNEGSGIKYRKVSAAGKFASPSHLIAETADANSRQQGIVFDERNVRFVGVWAAGNEIRSAAWDRSN